MAVATLYFARAVLVPFALAMLFSFLLFPVVRQLERLRLPRVPAVLLVVVLAMAVALTVATNVTNQLIDVASQLPNYKAHVQNKLAYLHNGGIGVVKATGRVSELGAEMAETLTSKSRAGHHGNGLVAPASNSSEPVSVQVVKPPLTSWESLFSLLTPLGVAGVVLVFTIFILLRLEDLRNRFIRLVGHNHLNVMTQALDDASQRIGKYLLMQFIVNVSYGIVVGTGLHFIGLPNALLWGALATVCRFLPYVGAPVAAFFPIALSLAVFDGWTRSLMIVGLFLVIEIVVGNFVEPLLYGANTGISSLAILVAAVFWTLLWGPIGLVLSTPLTVCLVVLGRHVPQMEFLHVLLGDEPVLTPKKHFYQRMLASDLADARRVLDQHLHGKRLQELYDSVVIPALSMAQSDLQQNNLDETVGDFIWQNTRELVEELSEEHVDPQVPGPEETKRESEFETDTVSEASPMRIVCVPARTGADETIAIMLTHLLEREGMQARCIPLSTNAEMIDQLVEEKPDVVIISALQPFGVTHAKKLYTRIRTRVPDIPVMLGLWNFAGELASVLARLGPDVPGLIVTNLAAAVQSLSVLTIEHRATNDRHAIASR